MCVTHKLMIGETGDGQLVLLYLLLTDSRMICAGWRRVALLALSMVNLVATCMPMSSSW